MAFYLAEEASEIIKDDIKIGKSNPAVPGKGKEGALQLVKLQYLVW